MTRSTWYALAAALAGIVHVSAAEPPAFATHPVSQRVQAGHWTELSADAAFDPDLSWSWLKNGLPVPGATNNRFILRNARAEDSGLYRAVAHNAAGETWSRAAWISVLHRNPAPGAVDSEFNDRFINGTTLNAVLPLSDGSAVIAGDFTGVGPRAIGRIARLAPDGNLDADFNSAGFGADGTVRSVVPDETGALYIAGLFATYNGQPAFHIARLRPDGSLDDTFVAALEPAVTDVRVLARQPDGKLLAAGSSISGGTTTFWIRRFFADGNRDHTFVSPPFLNGRVNCLLRQSDGRILVGGNFRQIPAGAAGQFNRVARILANGATDPTFLPSGAPNAGANNDVRAVATAIDGRIYLGGRFTAVNGTARFGLARLSATGALDPTFNPSPDDFVSALLVEDAGTVLVGGDFTRIGGATVRSLARLRTDGSAVESFVPPSFNGEVTTLIPTENDRLLVAGLFSQPHELAVRVHTAPPVYSAPVLVLAPVATTIHPGVSAGLVAAFKGHPEPLIQWLKDGAAIAGAEGPELSVIAPGSYAARATNSLGSVVSPPVVVAMETAPPGARPARNHAPAIAPISIPDSGMASTVIRITEGFIIDELRVRIRIDHPDTSQLVVEVVSPAGTTVRLCDQQGRRGRGFQGTIFADDAPASLDDGVAPFIGTFRPLNPLSVLRGQNAAGFWSVRVSDLREDFVGGTLTEVGFDLFAPAPVPSYATWANAYFGHETPGSQPQDDPNDDGFVNLLCYAMAHSPNAIPTPEWTRFNGTLRHRRWAAPSGVTCRYEFSGHLGGWSPSTPTEAFVRRFDDQTEEVVLRFPSVPPAGTRYFRVSAE